MSHQATAVSRVALLLDIARSTCWRYQMTLKRIHREIADVRKEDLGNIVLAPSEDDLFLWKGTIPGPEGSCYEGGIFNVDVKLARDYPYVRHLLIASCYL